MTDLTPVAEGAEVLVNTTTSGTQSIPVTAALTGGGYVVVWASEFQDGGGASVHAQLYAANGTPQGGEFLVNTTTAGNQTLPTVAALADGGFAIVWRSQDASFNGDVFAQRFDASGMKQGSELPVNTTTEPLFQGAPSIAGLDGGGFVVTWSSAYIGGSSLAINAQRYDETGAATGGEVTVTISTSQREDPTVTALTNGGYVITWTQTGAPGNDLDIYGQRFDASGMALGEFVINTATANRQQYASVSALENGGFVVAWTSSKPFPVSQDVQMQVFDASGMKVGDELTVNTFPTEVQEQPSVTGLADGGFVISWTSIRQINDEPSVAQDVFAQRFDDAGAAVGGEFLVNENTQFTQSQSHGRRQGLTELTDGSLVAVWNSNGDIFTRQFALPSDAPVNTLPEGADKTITIDEDAGHIFTLADFGFTDGDAGDELAAVTITSWDVEGAFFLNGSFAGTGTRVLASDIAAGNFSFGTLINANGDGYSSFTFKLEDQNGGLDETANTITFNVTPVAEAPEGADKTITIDEDTFHIFSLADFGFTDADVGDMLAAVTITAISLDGAYFLNGEFIGSGTRVLASDIAAGKLTYSMLPDVNGDAYASLAFKVEDQTGAIDATANTITINVTPVNDAPTGSDKTITIDEDTFHIFSLADVGFSDIDAGDSLAAVTITTIAGDGAYFLNGSFIGSGTRVEAADIAAGRLSYSMVADANGDNYSSFTFKVEDQSGALDEAANTITINVTPVDEPTTGYSPAGDNFQVNTTADEGQLNPSITGLAGGGYVIVWEDYSSVVAGELGGNGGQDVRGQLYDANGAPVGSEFVVNTANANTQAQPSVAALTDGGFVVAWHDYSEAELNDGENGYQIKAQRYDATGAPTGDEFLVNSTVNDWQVEAKVSGLSNGGFVITWTDYNVDEGNDEVSAIRAQVYDAAGNPVENEAEESFEFTVNTDGFDFRYNGDVVGLVDGGFVVAWTDFGASESGDDNDDGMVVARIFSNTGVALGDQFQINTASVAGQFDVDLAALTGGGFVATWADESDPGGGTSLKGQVFAADGTRVGGEFEIAPTYFFGYDRPSVATLLDGGFVITWQVPPGEGDPNTVEGQVFAADGNKVGAQFQIDNNNGSYQDDPVVTGLVGGGFAVAWATSTTQENALPGQDFSDSAITAQVFAPGSDPYDGVTILGTEGKDVLSPTRAPAGQPKATALNDKLYGFAGKDTLDGGAGGDLMEGGDGNDTYVIDDARDVVVEGGSAEAGSNDLMRSSAISFTLAANVENGTLLGDLALGITGNELANQLTGNSGANALYGFAGKDKLNGKAGSDHLYGGNESDTLIGEAGIDTLYGEAGADSLNGGLDSDILFGGAGGDKFVFDTAALGSDIDRIEDWSGSRGEKDKIVLSSIDADGDDANGNSKFTFIGLGGFTGAGAEVRVSYLFGDTVIQLDIDGDLVSDLSIVLTNAHTMTAADFTL